MSFSGVWPLRMFLVAWWVLQVSAHLSLSKKGSPGCGRYSKKGSAGCGRYSRRCACEYGAWGWEQAQGSVRCSGRKETGLHTQDRAERLCTACRLSCLVVQAPFNSWMILQGRRTVHSMQTLLFGGLVHAPCNSWMIKQVLSFACFRGLPSTPMSIPHQSGIILLGFGVRWGPLLQPQAHATSTKYQIIVFLGLKRSSKASPLILGLRRIDLLKILKITKYPLFWCQVLCWLPLAPGSHYAADCLVLTP